MLAVLFCLERICWGSLEFSTFPGISRWWSFEGSTVDPIPGHNLERQAVTSRAELQFLSHHGKKHRGLPRWPRGPVLDWAVPGRELAVPRLGEELLSHPRISSRCFPTAGLPWTLLGAEACWSFPLPIAFRVYAMWGPPSSRLSRGSVWGPFLKTKQMKKVIEKIPAVCSFLQHIMMCTAPKVEWKTGKRLFTKWPPFFVQMLLSNT